MIEIKHIDFSYVKGSHVFHQLSLTFREPGIYGLLGLNGSGKTTLLNLISSMYFSTQGTICIDGEDVTRRSVQTLDKLYYLMDETENSILRFRDYVRYYAPLYTRFSPAVLADCMQQFHVCGDDVIRQMSLGQKKKAFISFALAVGADVLLMDEPTNGLDIPSKQVFRQLLTKYVQDSQTVILSTHLVPDVAHLLDHFVILRGEGQVFSASAESLSERYAFTRQLTADGALYAEPCAEGYRVLRDRNDEYTDIDIELLFNAVVKGGLS